MSLRTRLTLLIVVLASAIVLTLSLVSLHSVASARFDDTLERASMLALQVQGVVTQWVNYEAASRPRPTGIEETRKLWEDIVEHDKDFPQLLRDTMASSRTIVAIMVTDGHGRVLASSDPNQTGKQAPELPALEFWQNKHPLEKLYDIFTKRQDYEVSLSLGASADAPPVFRIKVVVSSVLLRNAVRPQMMHLLIALTFSLLASLLLSVAAARLAFRPLARISMAIDKITGSVEPGAAGVKRQPDEVAAVQSKLDLLGQQFRGAREDVQKLQGRVEQLMERLEESILLFDRNDHLIMASRRTEDLLGLGRWEMMGRRVDELLPPTTTLGALVESAIRLRKPLHDHPLDAEPHDGLPQRLLVDVELLEDFPTHERMGTMVTLRDAETRQQIGAQLDIAARLAAISRLTGGVAHEIKNPLNAITLHLEVLKAKLGADGEPVAPEIGVISREIARLDRVVKTFLDFTRPVEISMSELDLCELAREVAALVRPQAGQQKVATEVTTREGGAWVRGDRDLLKQAALNLVVNGVEAMKDGGSLRIDVRREDGFCQLSVSDQGPGIPAEVRDKIFNLYFSTKGKGSGIGLAVTFRVVQLHGGTIEFSSEPGDGTTFLMRFPAIEGTAKG
jgi:PAS domain S-box-containing protein